MSEATTVQFNGINGAFNVESDLTLCATVPEGATTGPITISTPYGSVASQLVFSVVPPSPMIDSFAASPNIIQLCQPTQITLTWQVRNTTRITISRNGGQIINQENAQGSSTWNGQATDPQPQSDTITYTIAASSPSGEAATSVATTAGSAWPVIRAVYLTNNTVSARVSVWFFDGFDNPTREVVAELLPQQTATIEVPNCQLVNIKAIDAAQNFVRWESRLVVGNDRNGAEVQSWFN